MDHPLAWLAIAALATWRLTGLVVFDEGPLASCVWLRRQLVRVGLARLVGCFHCTAVWIAMPFAFAHQGFTWQAACVWWAIAGLASLLELGVQDRRWPPEDPDPEPETEP